VMKLLTFAWGDLYREYAERLALTCKVAGLDVEIVERKGKPKSREHAWAAKPGVILEALQAEEGPVLYMDADCFVRRPLELLKAVEQSVGNADFGLVQGQRDLRCGVIYAAPTVQAVQTLQELAAKLAEKPGSEEPLFAGIARECGARVGILGPEFCWCEKWGDRNAYGNVRPIIELNA
jgi:hypothetical protein